MQNAILGILILLGASYLYYDIASKAPDPRAKCEERPTESERDSCRNMIDFAMSAGW